jgi:hypothetical protein
MVGGLSVRSTAVVFGSGDDLSARSEPDCQDCSDGGRDRELSYRRLIQPNCDQHHEQGSSDRGTEGQDEPSLFAHGACIPFRPIYGRQAPVARLYAYGAGCGRLSTGYAAYARWKVEDACFRISAC